MGAESHEVWVKKKDVEKHCWKNGWIDENVVDDCHIKEEFFDAHFENVEGEVLDVAKAAGVPLLKDGEKDGSADYVFILDGNRTMAVIGKCQELIHESIMICSDDEYAKSETRKVLGYANEGWDDGIPRTLCLLLERLKNIKRAMDKHPDCLLVVEIAW